MKRIVFWFPIRQQQIARHLCVPIFAILLALIAGGSMLAADRYPARSQKNSAAAATVPARPTPWPMTGHRDQSRRSWR